MMLTFSHQVPASCIPILQKLQCVARLILRVQLSRNRNHKGRKQRSVRAKMVLHSRQCSYTRRVEAVMHTAPISSEDLGPVIVTFLEHSTAQNDQIIALLRFQVSTHLIP